MTVVYIWCSDTQQHRTIVFSYGLDASDFPVYPSDCHWMVPGTYDSDPQQTSKEN